MNKVYHLYVLYSVWIYHFVSYYYYIITIFIAIRLSTINIYIYISSVVYITQKKKIISFPSFYYLFIYF